MCSSPPARVPKSQLTLEHHWQEDTETHQKQVAHAEEANAEWFYQDLRDLPELTPEKDVLFIRGDWNAKVASQDDAVKVLHSIRQQIWKTQQWPQDWKRSVFTAIPKKDNAKECSNYRTIALIS